MTNSEFVESPIVEVPSQKAANKKKKKKKATPQNNNNVEVKKEVEIIEKDEQDEIIVEIQGMQVANDCWSKLESDSSTGEKKKKKKKKKKPTSSLTTLGKECVFSLVWLPSGTIEGSNEFLAEEHIMRNLGRGIFRYGQTYPPSIPLAELVKPGEFPEGEIQQYRDEYVL